MGYRLVKPGRYSAAENCLVRLVWKLSITSDRISEWIDESSVCTVPFRIYQYYSFVLLKSKRFTDNERFRPPIWGRVSSKNGRLPGRKSGKKELTWREIVSPGIAGVAASHDEPAGVTRGPQWLPLPYNPVGEPVRGWGKTSGRGVRTERWRRELLGAPQTHLVCLGSYKPRPI